MNNYEIILEDLRQALPTYITVLPPFYSQLDLPEVKVKALNRQIRRSKSNNNRVELLANLFHLGELLETHLDPNERRSGIKHVTPYYEALAKRIYYLYEPLGVEQIYRTRSVTTTMISKMSKQRILELNQEAATIAGARLEEEEVVNM